MNTAAKEPLIGVINAGSSSVKHSFYEGERRILGGQVDGIGAPRLATVSSMAVCTIPDPPALRRNCWPSWRRWRRWPHCTSPQNLAPIKMAMRLDPELPQVACFDTAFHRAAPEVEQAFALPYSFCEEGIRRYGFHGLSYEYIASVLPEHAPEIANGRVVVAHLGNGCSACAMRSRVSIATTMGFTAHARALVES